MNSDHFLTMIDLKIQKPAWNAETGRYEELHKADVQIRNNDTKVLQMHREIIVKYGRRRREKVSATCSERNRETILLENAQ